MKHTEMPKEFVKIDELFTTQPQQFREALTSAYNTQKRLAKETQEFSAATPTLGKAIFRIRLHVQKNPSDPLFAGRTPAECVRAFLGIAGDDKNALNHAQSCANAFRLAYAGMMGPETQTEDEAKTASTLTREKYFSEKDYDGQSGNTLGKISRILTKVNDDLKHPAVLDACAVIRGSAEKKSPLLQAILDRLDKAEDGTVKYLSEDEAKAEAEKSAKPSVLDAHTAASQLAKDNLEVLLAEVVAVAKSTEDFAVAEKVIRACAEAGFHLSAKFGREKVNGVFTETVNATAAAEKAAQAGKDAGLASGVKLVTAAN